MPRVLPGYSHAYPSSLHDPPAVSPWLPRVQAGVWPGSSTRHLVRLPLIYFWFMFWAREAWAACSLSYVCIWFLLILIRVNIGDELQGPEKPVRVKSVIPHSEKVMNAKNMKPYLFWILHEWTAGSWRCLMSAYISFGIHQWLIVSMMWPCLLAQCVLWLRRRFMWFCYHCKDSRRK